MPLFWLRVALGFYAFGLLYALVAITRTNEILKRVALHAAYLGMIFHLVSLSEMAMTSSPLNVAFARNSESLMGFTIMLIFMIVYLAYRTTAPGIIVFPVVFLLTFIAAMGSQPAGSQTTSIMPMSARNGWLDAHIALIFIGYAALLVSFSANLLYLIQENALKAKKSAGILARLPALERIDEIGFRSLLLGFPFMTLGLIAGIVVARATYGVVDLLDPKILLSILMWAIYMVLLYTRWNAGWRGKRAAYLAAGAFIMAVVVWAANYFSAIHKFFGTIMNFQLIGVNHKTAPVEIRERLAITESRLSEATAQLSRHPGVEEGLIISTCNRVELLAQTTNGSADLRAFLRSYFTTEFSEIENHLYEYHSTDAIRHLFRVTASLDSMVVGEPQILGQMKQAYATARAVGAVRSQLDLLLTRAFAVAKRVRSETAVGSSAVSIASVAVELAKKIFGSLQGKHVFLVGAGKMSELAARHLLAHGAASILVSNRTYDRAEQLAQKFNGEAVRFEDLYQNCDRGDIVITSTGAPHAIFRREHGEMFLNRRKNRPMFFIDIAVPRDVDPAMNKVEGIFLYDIDDLQQAVSSHTADRQKEAERAEQIISAEVDRFQLRLQTLDVAPTIVSLQDHLEAIRQSEIERVRSKLGALSPGQIAAVDALTRGIVNKIMHVPITTLKTAARESDATVVVDHVRRLFDLQGEDPREKAAETNKRLSEAGDR